MSRPVMDIKVTWADGKTIDALSKTLQQRMKYLNESAYQSIHATAMNALMSIRTGTRVAKPTGIKVALTERTDLVFSYTTEGGGGKIGSRSEAKLRRAGFGINVRRSDAGHRKMCLRNTGGVRYAPGAGVRVVYAGVHGVPSRAVKVFDFTDVDSENRQQYIIVASSQGGARKAAQLIVARRLLRFAGLARRAISALMVKTNNKAVGDNVSPRVMMKAVEVTDKRDILARGDDGGGKYALYLIDNLRYATKALNGGPAAVNLALKKAMNKTVSTIQHKCKNLLLPGELPVPFPEVTQRRRSA